MDRREVLKFLALGSACSAVSPEAFARFRALRQGLPPTAKLKILTAHQDATVIAMAELILPQTDTPGAKAARVNEFIDLIVADWYSDEERLVFLDGVAGVDARTQSLFKKSFIEASKDQQEEILRVLGEEMEEAAAKLIAAPRGYRGENPEPENQFYLMFRNLTLTGYFSSEAGFTQQLHEEIIPGHFAGCAPLAAPQKVAGS